MKEFKISHSEFTKIFTNRKFSWSDRMFKEIHFIENPDVGCYQVRERVSWFGKIALVLYTPIVLIGVLVWFGVNGVLESFGDYSKWFTSYTRIDDCMFGMDSTNKLVKLAGW